MNHGHLFSQQQKYIFCLSPSCPSPTNRMCRSAQLHQHHLISCNKWIVDSNTYANLTNIQQKESHYIKEEIEFYKMPIKGLIRYLECKEDIKRKIRDHFDDLKKQFVEIIDHYKNGKLREIDLFTKEMSDFRSHLMDCLESPNFPKIDQKFQIAKITKQTLKQASIRMNTLINSHKHRKPTLKDIVFYNTTNFQEQLNNFRKRMNNLCDSVCCQSEMDGACERVKYEDMQAVQQMLALQKENKSETITQLLNWAESDYFLQKNHRINQIRCPICSFKFEITFQFSIGKSKLDYTNILTQHLLQSHFLFLSICHSHRITRSSVYQLPLSQVIYLMSNYQYDQIDIYDGSNVKQLKYDPNPRCLTVLFMPDTVKRQDLQYCYCITNSPEQAAFNIILLINEICINLKKAMRILNFKKQYYNLYNTIILLHNINCKFEDKPHPTQIQKTNKLENKSKGKKQN